MRLSYTYITNYNVLLFLVKGRVLREFFLLSRKTHSSDSYSKVKNRVMISLKYSARRNTPCDNM